VPETLITSDWLITETDSALGIKHRHYGLSPAARQAAQLLQTPELVLQAGDASIWPLRLILAAAWEAVAPAPGWSGGERTYPLAMDLSRITHNPEQCGGKPCIRGIRIRVRDILELYAAGMSSQDIQADYPDLEPEDLRAALDYAARALDHPVLVG
jgi:uncharacterized protein (DUF433 family)